MKSRRFFFVILLIIACAVWAHDFMLLFNAKSAGKVPSKVATTAQVLEKFVYKPDFPDPFFCKQVMVERRAYSGPHTGQKKKEEVKLPSCKIGGIVYNESNPMAIFVSSGKSQLVKQGDMIDSITIRKISRDSVEVLFKGKKFSLTK
jgi:type II secretory pathway component PulC